MKGVRRDSTKYLKHIISMHLAKKNVMVKATMATIKPKIIISQAYTQRCKIKTSTSTR
jgi:hypothetical protein